MDGCKHELRALPQGARTEHEHKHALPTRGDPVACRPDWPPREGATKCTWPLQKMPHEGTLTTSEARVFANPRRNHPRGDSRIKRPLEGQKSERGSAAHDRLPYKAELVTRKCSQPSCTAAINDNHAPYSS